MLGRTVDQQEVVVVEGDFGVWPFDTNSHIATGDSEELQHARVKDDLLFGFVVGQSGALAFGTEKAVVNACSFVDKANTLVTDFGVVGLGDQVDVLCACNGG